MIRLLIVDDHALVREGLREILKETAGFKVVGEANSGEEAVTLSRQLLPDVVLMDLSMPGIGGLEATTKLLRMSPETKVLVITARDDLLFPKRVLCAGAVGYMTKEAKGAEVVRAIRAVHTGQRYISPSLATQLAMKSLEPESDVPFEQLSKRELQVALMVTKVDKVSTIAEKLCLSPKTVNSYRYRIFQKFDLHNDVELTHFALRHGLVEKFPAEVESAKA